MKRTVLSFWIASALVLLGALPVPASAEAPTLIPREILFGNPTRATPKISPDGTRLAYLKADEKNVMQVFVVTRGKTDDRQVTKDPKRGIRDYFWGYDGKNVFYTQDTGGDENTHVYAANIDSGETRDMTPILGVKAMAAGHEPEKPNEMLIAMNRRTKALFDVWKLDIGTGALTLVEENPGNADDLLVDRDLKVRGYTSIKPVGGGELWMRDAAGATPKKLMEWAADDAVEAQGFSQDGKTLYYVSNVKADTKGLYALDVATGASTLVVSDPGVDAGTILVHETSGKPQAVSFSRDLPKWKVIDPAIEDDFKALGELAAGGGFGVTSRDLADKTWVVGLFSDVKVPRWVIWDRATKKAEPLFSARPELEPFTLSTMKPVEVKARDGLSIPALLTLPAGVEPKGLPTVVLVHGGPWSRDRWGFDPQTQWLANRGYAVLQVNYRGSSGFGRKHMLAAKREFAGKMHTDLLDALDWAVKEGITDPKRVGIMGGSYGGYATLVGLSFTPDVFACGVDIVGPSNLVSLVESFPAYWGPSLVNTWFPYVGDPKNPAERKDMEARSPLFKVADIKAPLLVGQGANDPRVTKKEAEQIVDAIKKKGGVVEYVVYADEGHGFARPENRLDFYGKAEGFLSKHLGGRAEPAASK